MLPATLMMIALTACLASVLRRKSTAIAAASGIIVASYFLDFIGRAVANEIVNAAQKLSFFTYYDSQDVILNGLNAGNMALLLALTAILVASWKRCCGRGSRWCTGGWVWGRWPSWWW
jgi:hypothetical protein